MKRNTPVFGIVILIIGVLVLLNTFDLFEVGFWFWAALCFIVPCFIGLFSSQHKKFKYLVGIAIGLMMLLYNFDIIKGRMLFPACAAVCLILAGFKAIAGAGSGNGRTDRTNSTYDQNTNYTYGYTQDSWDSWDGNCSGNVNNGTYGNDSEAYNGTNDVTADPGNGTYFYGDAEIIPPQGIAGSGSEDVRTTKDHTEETPQDNGNGWFAGADTSYDGGPQPQPQPQPQPEFRQKHYQYNADDGQTVCNRPENDSGYRFYNIRMDGREIVYRNEPFHGLGLKTVCGSVTLNLRDAIITKDVNIDINASLSGVEILVPRNINIVVIGNPVLGGIDNNTVAPPPGNTFPTIYIKAECSLSGVDINY